MEQKFHLTCRPKLIFSYLSFPTEILSHKYLHLDRFAERLLGKKSKGFLLGREFNVSLYC
jgi:hypothetical protein